MVRDTHFSSSMDKIKNFLVDSFGKILSRFTHFGTVSPLSMFSINQPSFLQKLSYMQISSIYLGLGFEFGPQRIRDLAFMCQ